MTTLAIQKRIVSKLKETEDKSLLEIIYKLLISSEDANKILSLTKSQKAGIRKGLKDIEEGRTMTNAKAQKDLLNGFFK